MFFSIFSAMIHYVNYFLLTSKNREIQSCFSYMQWVLNHWKTEVCIFRACFLYDFSRNFVLFNKFSLHVKHF
ncbi:MAG: hypothetical protein CSB01_00025 [Bacteroidia bacterium]|nr:MAG: hypothetical protein CSB01_00025 [Bacteroidia bacterium]